VHGIVLEHVGEIIDVEQVVDTDYFNICAAAGSTENHATDTSETIDTDFDCHLVYLHFDGC